MLSSGRTPANLVGTSTESSGGDTQVYLLLVILSTAKKTSSTTPVFSTSSGDTEFLDCKQGDLLLVEKHYSWSASSYTFRATNQRTRSRGLVLKEVLQFLPTLSRPSEQTLVMQVVQENETYHDSQNMEIMKKLYPHIFICIKYKKDYSKKVLIIIRSKKISNHHQNPSVPSSTLCAQRWTLNMFSCQALFKSHLMVYDSNCL